MIINKNPKTINNVELTYFASAFSFKVFLSINFLFSFLFNIKIKYFCLFLRNIIFKKKYLWLYISVALSVKPLIMQNIDKINNPTT